MTETLALHYRAATQKSTGEDDEKTLKSILDRTGLSLHGSGHRGNRAPHSAHRPLLHGDPALLCEKLPKTARLVHRYELIQKTSGQLRSEKSHDRRNKMQDHRNGHRCYGHRLSLHEKCAHRQGLHCRGVGLPFAVLHPAGQDHKACGTETGERRVIAFHWGIHVPLRSTNAKLSLWQFHFIIHFYKSILFIQWSSHLSCF